MSLFPIATACCGGVAAGALGAAAGAATAAIVHAQVSEALVPFDGAWLGLAFATPLGIVIGWVLACKKPDSSVVSRPWSVAADNRQPTDVKATDH